MTPTPEIILRDVTPPRPKMTVFSLDEKDEPLAQAGQHAYPGMPGVSGLVKPGMLIDVKV